MTKSVVHRHSTIYWWVVRDCLVEIFSVPKKEAEEKVRQFKKDLKEAGEAVLEMAYHDEPCYTAGHLAGIHEAKPQEEIIGKHWDKYREIWDTRYL